MQVEEFPAVEIRIVQNTLIPKSSVFVVDVKVNTKVKEIARIILFIYLVKQLFT